MTAGLGFLKMSRGAEREADLLGVGILYDAGYDPRGMPQFFETIQAKYGAGGSQFMSDHPNPGNRSEYVDKEIASFVRKPSYVTTSPAFAAIQKQVNGMHAYTAKEVASGAWKTQSPNQTVGEGVHQAVGETVDLSTTAEWKTFHGSGFSIDVPGNWQGYGSNVSAMFGLAGGIARSADGRAGGVIYGMLTDRYQPQGRVSVSAGLDALVAEITRDNPGLVPDPRTHATAAGGAGRSVECENPSGNDGKGEHDWIVVFQHRNGALRYFVFVAPTPDFEKLRPTFSKMIETVKLQ
jgi:hypothetical protein